MSISAMKMALEALEWKEAHLRKLSWEHEHIKEAAQALRQAIEQAEKPRVDAVLGFTATEPRQSLSRMKPGDRFVLVRTGEIYRIKNDGSQWNETRQRLARLHKNSQVRLIVDAVSMKQERVDETAKGEHSQY
jgi:hypothetical protein